MTDYLFFPHITDPKSWLLKNGSVFVSGNQSSASQNVDDERELLLLTHGFVVIDVLLRDVFRLFFALSDQEFLTEAVFMDYVRVKLNLNRSEEDLDDEEVYEFFYELGIPKPRNLVNALLKSQSKLPTREFRESLYAYISNKLPLDLSEPGPLNSTNVEKAKLFSSVARVDSLSISHTDDPRSIEMYTSDQADFSLSLSLFDDNDGPFYFTFATSEDREVWLSKFGDSVILAWENSSHADRLKMQTKIGWQHLVVRASPTTYVILNDHDGLEKCLNKTHVDLNILDHYNGYSALHYATILGHTCCAEVLLRSGAAATLHDKDGLSPMIHGK